MSEALNLEKTESLEDIEENDEEVEEMVYARLSHLRIAPRKVQIVCDLIRGKDVETAKAILAQTPKAASKPLMKLLMSAAANAEQNKKMRPESLYVSEVYVTPGPTMKRIMPRAQGRAYRINKRSSHVTLAVAEMTAEA